MPNPITFIQRILTKFDQLQQRHPNRLGFIYAVVKKYGDDQASYQAALLTYYGFLSLFPLLLVVTSLLKLVLRNDVALREHIIHGLLNYFPNPTIVNDLQGVHSAGGAGIALITGLLLTFYGARGVADIFRNAANHVWQVPKVRRPGFPKSVLQSLLIIIVGGIGLLLAPLISGFAVSAGHGGLVWILSLVITLAILFGVVLFALHITLSEHHHIKDFWMGALFAAVGLVALQNLGTYVLTSHLKSLNNLYGTFALVLGLLYWIYLQMEVLMYGLEIDSVRGLHLWPRSLQQPLTGADRHAYELYADRNQFIKGETITVDHLDDHHDL
jgi:membrane protein